MFRTSLGAQQPVAPEIALTGQVADASGAIMQGVIVRVLPASGGDPVRETKTDAKGQFTLPLPAGKYRVQVTATSFKPFEQVVSVARGMRPLKVVLQLAQIEESIVVTFG